MPRTRRPFVLPAALLLALLAGCAVVPGGDPYPDPPRAGLDELLGIDRGEDGALLDSLLEEGVRAILDGAAGFDETADAQLQSAIRGASTGGTAASAPRPGAMVAPAALVHAVTPMAAPGMPGVDVPVVTDRTKTETGTRDGHGYTTTTTDTSTIRDQREVTVHEVVTTVDDPESGRGSTQRMTTTQEKDPCAAQGEPAGTWTTEQSQRIMRDGTAIVVDITTTGTVVSTGDGSVSLRGVTVTMRADGSGADGANAPTTSFTVTAEIDGWDTRGDLTDARGRWSVDEASGMSEADALALAGAQLDAYQGIASDVADRSAELRRNDGVCVRILVDTHGETTLADGEQARLGVRVVDPATGEELTDAVVEIGTSDGSVSPTSVRGHGEATFTAAGDPDYRVVLSTETDRGGHTVTVRYGAPGWRFEGLSYDYTIRIRDEDSPVTITWEGQVCGDYQGDWQLGWQIRSPYGSPQATGTQRPVPLDEVTPGDRAILVYQEVPNPRDGEPPFRLWIDDQNSGKTPAQQRIEIHPEPLTGPCSEG